MNLGDMIGDVRERCGLLARDQMASDNTLTRLINRALHAIETDQPSGWPWLRATETLTFTVDQGNIPFADLSAGTVLKVRAVRMLIGTEWQPLERTNIAMLRQHWPNANSSLPQSWATDGYTLVVRPAPNDDYAIEVDVVLAEPDLVDVADVPLMPASFHDTIVEKAAYLEFRRTRATNDAQIAAQAVTDGIQRMRRFSRTQTGPGTVTTRED